MILIIILLLSQDFIKHVKVLLGLYGFGDCEGGVFHIGRINNTCSSESLSFT